MNIPLHRLYRFIENIAEQIHGDRVIIYRFWPHGSKNVNNLDHLYGTDGYFEEHTYPALYCHDQEPVDHEFLERQKRTSKRVLCEQDLNLLRQGGISLTKSGLVFRPNMYKKNILLHSELRSVDVDRYESTETLVPVYYWSHAIIARDWYRYAEHEQFKRTPKFLFLIYNRAWSGTRNYRIKFADLLIDNQLIDDCKTSFNAKDPESGEHYRQCNKHNPWQANNLLEHYFLGTHADATASGDFCTDDYNSTEIEVILETLFDDSRLHLTEKILRPMACGQPFILCANHGSLDYLKHYGFETFSGIWDESYDTIQDPHQRLACVINLMKQISNWDRPTKQQKLQQARHIAQRNKLRFFSNSFMSQVTDELKKNLTQAFKQIYQSGANPQWMQNCENMLAHPELIDLLGVDCNHVALAKTCAEKTWTL